MKRTVLKRFLSACLAALMLAALFPATAFAYAAGDVDGDGLLRAQDARLCLRCAVGLEHFSAGGHAFTAADINGDGQITAADARLILRAAVGLNIDEGLSGKTIIKVPVSVYSGKRGTVSLTGYQTVEDGPLADGPYLVCTLRLTDTSGMPYTVSAESVTVNGVRLPDGAASAELPANGSTELNVVIPTSGLAVSAAGEPVADEILVRIPFYSPTEKRTYHAKIALYPTGRTPGTVAYAPTAPKSVSKNADAFVFGFNGADYATASAADGTQRIDDVVAAFYFRNKTKRDLTVEFTDISLNDGAVAYPYPQSLYVFAGTAATPTIHMTTRFFSAHAAETLKNLQYTILVRDAKTDEVLYQKAYNISGIKERVS